MAAISQLSFFLFLPYFVHSSASCLENSLKGGAKEMGGGAVRGSENGKCLSAFYVVAHFSLTKLNDWLSVPFRMVSGSKNPHSGQPTTGKMPHATCHMQHVSAAPLNCISLPNTSIITPKKK